MIKHIVMWNFKKEIPEEDKAGLKEDMRVNLLSLVGKVPGLLKADYIAEPIPSSTHDMALVTELESVEALKGYSGHPEHVKVADTYVRPFVCDRSCLDFAE